MSTGDVHWPSRLGLRGPCALSLEQTRSHGVLAPYTWAGPTPPPASEPDRDDPDAPGPGVTGLEVSAIGPCSLGPLPSSVCPEVFDLGASILSLLCFY